MDLPEELHARTKVIIPYTALDDYIEAKLGRAWSLGQNGEYPNGTLAYYEVGPDPEATAAVQAWLDSPVVPCPGRCEGRDDENGVFVPEQPGFAEGVRIYTEQILNELCNRGLLPAGDYTVDASW